MYSLTDTEILMRARTAASVLRHLGRSLCSVPFKHEVLSLLQAIHLLLAFYLVRVRSDFFYTVYFAKVWSNHFFTQMLTWTCAHSSTFLLMGIACHWKKNRANWIMEQILKSVSTCAKLKTQIRVGKFHHKNCYQLRYTRSKYRMIYSGRCKRHFISLYWEKKLI